MSIKTLKTVVFASVVSLFFAGQTVAQDEWPFEGGDYWEVTSVELMPGQNLNYARHLANQWRGSMEFSKSKGWIKDYMVLANIHARDGEPDMYLVTVMETWEVSNAEGDKRQEAWMEYNARTMDKMQEEYGDRSTMRRIMGDSFLRVLNFRD